MIIKYFLFSLISLFSGFFMLLLSGKILYFIIILLIFLLMLFGFYFLVIKNREGNFKKYNDLLIFLHDFLYSYLSSFNYEESIIKGLLNLSDMGKEQLSLYKEYSAREQLMRFSSYFLDHNYRDFLTVILEEDNTNRNTYLKRLIDKNNKMLEFNKLNKDNKKTVVLEFFILWVISFLILLVLRLAINNYFDKISQNIFYNLGLILYFLIWLFSLLFLINFLYSKEASYD